MVLLLAPNVSMVKSSSIFRLAVRFPRFRWSCLTSTNPPVYPVRGVYAVQVYVCKSKCKRMQVEERNGGDRGRHVYS